MCGSNDLKTLLKNLYSASLPPQSLGVFALKTMTYITFKVNRKLNVLEFQKDYDFPIEYFNIRLLKDDEISEGLYHLLSKNWFNEITKNEVLDFLKKEYPDFNFMPTIEKHKKYLEFLQTLF